MVMGNPESEGAPGDGPSSEGVGQVAEPSLQDVLTRLDRQGAVWQSRFNDLYNGVQSMTQRELGQIGARIVGLEGQLGDVQTKTELAQRLLEQGFDKEQITAITDAVK